MSDPVTAPAHYCRGGIEFRQVIEAFDLDGHYWLANAVKYLLRAPHKGNFGQDIDKAIQCLQFAKERANRKANP